LDRKLKVEQDTEGSAGMVETSWEKTAAGMEMEMAMEKKTTQTGKTMAKMEKRTVKTEQTVEETQQTTAVNKKMEWESLYQNCCNTHQTDSRTILYNLKMKKLNQE
jgi:hypothetical protein